VAIAGLQPNDVRYDFTGGDRGWKGDVPIVRFDSSKIRAMGWRNRRSSAEALRDAMEAMRKEIEC
jgi:UDP-glucose 4-epimerase